MKTLLDPVQKHRQLERLSKLTQDMVPHWGILTAADLLPHLTDPFRVALGEYEAKTERSFLSTSVGKFIAIYVLPQWPKGTPTHAKTDITKQGRRGKDFDRDKKELVCAIDRFLFMYSKNTFSNHPIFGEISNCAWAVVMNKHLEHHFRQFGL